MLEVHSLDSETDGENKLVKLIVPKWKKYTIYHHHILYIRYILSILYIISKYIIFDTALAMERMSSKQQSTSFGLCFSSNGSLLENFVQRPDICSSVGALTSNPSTNQRRWICWRRHPINDLPQLLALGRTLKFLPTSAIRSVKGYLITLLSYFLIWSLINYSRMSRTSSIQIITPTIYHSHFRVAQRCWKQSTCQHCG